jgi:hypothetical protein
VTTDEYLAATEDGAPSIAAAEVMDRLAERLNSVGTTAERMKETRSAAEAIAELAAEADEPLAPIESAENAAGSVAEKGRTPKDTILEAISKATKDVRRQAAEAGLSLGHGYALDRYLEEDLETVRRIESTDHHTETTLSWQFSDGVTVEMDDGTHLEKYNFYKKLAMGTRKKLQPDLVSEEVGDPNEDVDEYARLSIGPTSRPWAEQNWIRCITDLLEERQEFVESVGARTMAWEAVANEIRLSRAVSNLEAAVDQTMPHAKLEDDDLSEIWLPGKLVTNKCEEYAVTPKALQEELSARGVNSDDLGGDRIAERIVVDGNGVRFWRLDATHDEVPEPAEIVDEVETGADRLRAMEWGGLDDE